LDGFVMSAVFESEPNSILVGGFDKLTTINIIIEDERVFKSEI